GKDILISLYPEENGCTLWVSIDSEFKDGIYKEGSVVFSSKLSFMIGQEAIVNESSFPIENSNDFPIERLINELLFQVQPDFVSRQQNCLAHQEFKDLLAEMKDKSLIEKMLTFNNGALDASNDLRFKIGLKMNVTLKLEVTV